MRKEKIPFITRQIPFSIKLDVDVIKRCTMDL